ncbi:MAG: (d)CMP kinase [Candidatus Eremiobacteraeota bacterium]|nr:(d)CMP kinase [Candidatus Eremiobacteraeota bacterium]
MVITATLPVVLRGRCLAWANRPGCVTKSSSLRIAIDGPAAAGKTTVARATAHRLGILYLDTGAMYRTLACLALRAGTDADNGAALARLMQTSPIAVELDESAQLGFRIFAGGHELDETTLSSNEVTAIVSTVAAQPQVRTEMVSAQRRIAHDAPVVMAGRDIGTVVLPDAPVKIYLTASIPARIERRRRQLQAAGFEVDAHRLAQEIEERDRLDQSRAISPLAPAPDAHIIDSSEIDAERVVDEICAVVAAASP